jgi:hypothetical protein
VVERRDQEVTIMRADAILLAQVPTTSPIQHDPTEAIGLTPIDQVRRQVATALFGELVPLPQVGRFQVAKILGTGGMGVVYEAHDPQLGRKVALKLLQPMTSGERARERLLREAQAMAQLQHPNVVGVYEAGVHGEQVYVAMEYVENGTLGEWLRARPRTWQETVDMLLQAGEGLSAAHAAGLVHRDFKPANILMGGGRARISDFGLARATATAEDLERTAEDSSGMLLGAPLTRTGSLLGTPAYMAPEQLRGDPATPASDQFAFGVVLYESLYGHRPFQGESLGVLMHAIEEGRIARPERRLAVPAKLSAVIRRALARDPAQRFPNMASLLEALRAARRIRWTRWVAPVLGAGIPAALVVTGMAAVYMHSSPPPALQAAAAALVVGCAEGDPLAGVWDPQRRASVEQALTEAGVDARALASLDDYATQWKEQQALRCANDTAQPQWAETCLADRRVAIDDLARAIVDAPAPLRAGAPAAVSLLPALSDCTGEARPTATMSDNLLLARQTVWRARLGFAEAFGPHVAARAPQLYRSALLRDDMMMLRNVPRMRLELDFAAAIQSMHPESAPREPWGSALTSPFVESTPARGGQDPKTRLTQLARTAAEEGHEDIAARSWVLVAELLEAGPHGERARKEAWTGAEQALGRLSKGHPLWPVLTRDLAYIQLAHARHTTQPNTCAAIDADFEACSAVFSATRHLKVLAGSPAGTPADGELLARAYEHTGKLAEAEEVRRRNGPVVLDESALGYLDLGAGTVVTDGPTLHDSLHCDADGTNCQIDRKFAAELENDLSILIEQTRIMPSVKDGVARGTKFYAIRADSALKLLGFKNGDLMTAIDGQPFDSAEFLGKFKRVVTTGGTLTVERKGKLITRTFSLR